MTQITKRVLRALIVSAFVFLLGLVSPCRAFARAEIFSSAERCVISILLRKEFYAKTPPALAQWIALNNRYIAEAQEILNRGTVGKWFWGTPTQAERDRAQSDINYYTAQNNDLQAAIAAGTALTRAQLEALVSSWKAEIERKWTLPDYVYRCCKVEVKCVFLVRDENAPPKEGFDQIGIVPGNFRSFISTNHPWNFDANGFSNTPYEHDMGGTWSMNTINDYEAPHEAGHEMGLKDQYTDPPAGGGSIPVPGHENDIMDGGGAMTAAQLARLSPVSTSGATSVDNIATILDSRRAHCEPACCERHGERPDIRIGFATGLHETGRRHYDEPVRVSVADVGRAAIPDKTKATDPTAITPDELTPGPAKEGVQYKQTDSQGVKVDTGIHYQDTPGGVQVDTTTLATGKGPDFRNWEVTDTSIMLDGKKIKPVKKDRFYVPKESAAKGAATAIFVGLGLQYEDKMGDGEVCPVTGERIGGGPEKGEMARAIDRAGMAAGMGLLVSQAKGEITGQKSSFSLDEAQAQQLREGKGSLRVISEHIETRKRNTTEVPLGEVAY